MIVLRSILATLILKEVFTRRKLLAVILAMTGIILVTLFNTNKDKKNDAESAVEQVYQIPADADTDGS